MPEKFESLWIELNWVQIFYKDLRIDLNWVGECLWIELNWIGLNFRDRWIELSWVGNVFKVQWIGLNSTLEKIGNCSYTINLYDKTNEKSGSSFDLFCNYFPDLSNLGTSIQKMANSTQFNPIHEPSWIELSEKFESLWIELNWVQIFYEDLRIDLNWVGQCLWIELTQIFGDHWIELNSIGKNL